MEQQPKYIIILKKDEEFRIHAETIKKTHRMGLKRKGKEQQQNPDNGGRTDRKQEFHFWNREQLDQMLDLLVIVVSSWD